MHLDWDKLRIFHVVAEAGSLTSAGQHLNLSQSAVSRQISTLEQQLGTPLFHRHARGLILSEQGELLLKATKDVHQKLIQIEGRISDSQISIDGPLKITLPGFLGYAWLARRLAKFQDRYPDIQLTLIMDNRVLNLSMREADAAIRLYDTPYPDLTITPIGQIHIHLCASAQYLEKHGIPKNAASLREHRLLGYPPNASLPHTHADWVFSLAGVDKETHPKALLLNSTNGILAACSAGCGIACLPDFMVDETPELQRILPKIEAPVLPIYFVHATERSDSTRIRLFQEFLEKELAQSPNL